MAAELETQLNESSKLLVSSGGVFEVEHKGKLIFSKKATGRFPEDGEVLRIIYEMEQGKSLEEAQAEAARNVHPTPSFMEWLGGLLRR